MTEVDMEHEKKISIREMEDEELDHELSRTAKKAQIRELKSRYGPGWKQALSWIKSMKVDKETARNLHGDFSGLREYGDPRPRRSSYE